MMLDGMNFWRMTCVRLGCFEEGVFAAEKFRPRRVTASGYLGACGWHFPESAFGFL